MSLDFFLNHTITVETPVTAQGTPGNTRDPSGGVQRAWQGTVVATDIPASVQPLPAHEQWKFGQRQVFLTHRIYCAFDPQAKRGDRVTDMDTRQQFVVETTANVAGWYGMWEILCREQTS